MRVTGLNFKAFSDKIKIEDKENQRMVECSDQSK